MPSFASTIARLPALTTRFHHSRSGIAAVEFALIGPVAVLILVGMIAYGMLFSVHLSLQHLLDETARSTVAGLTTNERAMLAGDYFAASIGGYATLEESAAELAVSDDGRFTRIEIRYDLSDHPVYAFHGLLPLPASPLVYQQTLRNGGF